MSMLKPEKEQPVLILGNRTYAEEMADVIGEIPGWRVGGFVENEDRARCAQTLHGLPIHWVDDLAQLAADHHVIGGLATTTRCRFTEQARLAGARFATLVHPSAQVSATSQLGEGVFLNRGVIVATYSSVGDHCLVNRQVTIGHHTAIGEHCTIQPGVNIAGLCAIDERVYFGMGATVIDRIRVGSGSVVGAGAVVVDEVPARCQVVGVPARVNKRDIEGK